MVWTHTMTDGSTGQKMQ